MPEPDHTATPRRAALVFIFITVVLDMLALGMIVPVLPKLVEDFVGGNTARAAEIYGLFGTVWALMQFVFSPVLGALSDRFGRRPVILLSNFGLGLDYIVMALAPDVSWLFVGRVISGITSASTSTAYAYIADVAPPEKRAAGFGMLSAAFGLGFVVGPAIGGVLGNIDPRLPFWVAAGFSFLNYMYGLLVLPESLSMERRERFSWRRANPMGSLKLLRSHRELFGLAIVNFIGSIAHEGPADHFRAVRDVSLRMERADGRTGDRGGGRMLRGGGRRAGRAGRRAIRRAARDARRTALRRGRLHDLRAGGNRRGFLGRVAGERAVGAFRTSDAGHDDPACGFLGTGTTSGRAQQSARNRVHDRPSRFHKRLRELYRNESRLAPTRCAVSAGGADDRGLDGDGVASHTLALQPAGGTAGRCGRRV